MKQKLLSISEFSRLSGISRKSLIFYDRVGVFSPAEIGKNRYRRYSYRQLQGANVVVALRAIDVPLREIKTFLRIRTPKRLIELCDRQERRISEEIDTLTRVQEIIHSLNAATESAARVNTGRFELRDLPSIRLFMGPTIGESDMATINDALSDFYELCAAKKIPQTHPLGSMTNVSNTGKDSCFRPIRFYCPAGQSVPETLTVPRPAGRYAIGHAYGDYGMLDGLYRKLLGYIRRKGLNVIGDAYEEYILSEMALHDPGSYLARVAIQVV